MFQSMTKRNPGAGNKMRITITGRELLDRDIWDKYCELEGMNIWAINEGLLDEDEKLDIPWNVAIKLGKREYDERKV